MKVIIDLCGGTGSWSEPYRQAAGYHVIVVDPLAQPAARRGAQQTTIEEFIRDPWVLEMLEVYLRPQKIRIHGILAAPPCTNLARSGARWWKQKGDAALAEGLQVVYNCMEVIAKYEPEWWCLENPVGRLSTHVGKAVTYFDPCDYGDPYTKRTGLWGNFNIPKKNPVKPTEGSKMHLLPPGPERWRLRSITPPGFARAFFEANP